MTFVFVNLNSIMMPPPEKTGVNFEIERVNAVFVLT